MPAISWITLPKTVYASAQINSLEILLTIGVFNSALTEPSTMLSRIYAHLVIQVAEHAQMEQINTALVAQLTHLQHSLQPPVLQQLQSFLNYSTQTSSLV